MPEAPRLTSDDLRQEIDLLKANTDRFPSLRILTDQAPAEVPDPQRIGLPDPLPPSTN
jgi:hypothetical protein